MLFALSTGHKLGLLIAAAILITFSLLSSFYFPRRNPDFPGPKGLRRYLVVVLVLVLGMLAAVEIFGSEPKEATAGGETTTGTTTTSTSTQPAKPAGDPVAGKSLFTAQGCGACHTFAPAGSTGTIGPNLANLAPSVTASGAASLGAYTLDSIVDPNLYVVPGYPKGVMPQNFGTTLTDKQLADLVAFIDAGQS